VVLVTLAAVTGLGVAASACRRSESGMSAASGLPPVAASHSTKGVAWVTDWDTALSRAKKENKVVVVDFYADWCVWCRRLDSTTYRDPAVVRFLAEKTVPLKLNVEGSPGRALANKYGVDGLPTIVILGADGREVGRIPGYMPADRFLETVKRYASRG
jgi:thiol:disulfide interchange protein